MEKRNKTNTPSKGLVTRRNLISAGAFLFGGLFLFQGIRKRAEFCDGDIASAQKITMTEKCVGCTGCVSACPTSAILVETGQVAVVDEKCIRCGYCSAVCPVGGIRVNREQGNG